MGRSGRPKGSKSKLFIKEYFKPEEIKDLVENAKRMAQTDTKMAAYLLDHIFGKAVQPTEISGKNGGPIEIGRLEVDLKAWAKH